MLFVKTYLDKSPIHGIGLFAAERIPKGTLIWKFVSGFDVILKEKEVKRLPKAARAWISQYTFKNWRGYVLSADHDKFFNHVDEPNVDDTDKEITIAKRDIRKGEELTCNYFDFDKKAHRKLGKKQSKK